MTDIPRDPWKHLGARTPARIALGRAGASLPTHEVLSFALAHAQARDAVHARLDRLVLAAQLQSLRLDTIEVESKASDRATYLRRPDLGRQLDDDSRARVKTAAVAAAIGLVAGRSPRGRRSRRPRSTRRQDGGSISAWAEEPLLRPVRAVMSRVDLRVGGGASLIQTAR